MEVSHAGVQLTSDRANDGDKEVKPRNRALLF